MRRHKQQNYGYSKRWSKLAIELSTSQFSTALMFTSSSVSFHPHSGNNQCPLLCRFMYEISKFYYQTSVKCYMWIAACLSGFTHVQSVNGCYKLVTDNLDWAVAGLRCKSLHPKAHLLIIDNYAEQEAIKTWMSGHSGTYFYVAFGIPPVLWTLVHPTQTLSYKFIYSSMLLRELTFPQYICTTL